jgi:hypothetical protein
MDLVVNGLRRNLGTPSIATAQYIFECLVTAFLICFGAPLWNDIAKSVLRLKKGPDAIDTDETMARS